MASPTNSSGKLTVDAAGSTTVTQNVGFAWTAGRTGIVVISHYDGSNGRISAVTIGGTAATRRAQAQSSEPWATEIWDTQSVAGGTSNVVITTPNAGGYFTFQATEWASGVISGYDTGTGNSAIDFVSAPTVSTATTTSQAQTLVFAAVCNAETTVSSGFTTPSTWTSLFLEQDSTAHQAGSAAYKEESSAGTKTALFGQTGSSKSFACIAAYRLASGTTNYTITADSGTYSLTGQAATTKVGRVITAAQGSYALTGQVANLIEEGVDYTLIADSGTYSITGSDGFADYAMAANFDSYNITGQAARLARAYTVIGETGVYNVTGTDVSLLWSGSGPKIMVADSGTYTLSGQSNTLRRAAKLVCEGGLYSINGFTVVGGASADSGTSTGIGPLKVRKVLVVSTSGRTKWVNYIPVKQVGVSTGAAGRTDNGGAIEVELIGSGTGLTEWIDYIPVVEVGDGEEYRWRYDNSGWLPIIVVE